MQPESPAPIGSLSRERVTQAVAAVRERLLRSTAALERFGVRYAVIGANAVAVWVARVDESAVRNTPDVNILVERTDLEQVYSALETVGLVKREVGGRILCIVREKGASERRAVHLSFANEKVHDDDLLPATDLSESQAADHFRDIDLGALVRMKLTTYRTKDRAHLRDLAGVGLIDANWPARFQPELAARLQQILDNPNG